MEVKPTQLSDLTLNGGQSVVPEVETSEIELGPRAKPRHSLQLIEPQMKVCHTIYQLHMVESTQSDESLFKVLVACKNGNWCTHKLGC